MTILFVLLGIFVGWPAIVALAYRFFFSKDDFSGDGALGALAIALLPYYPFAALYALAKEKYEDNKAR